MASARIEEYKRYHDGQICTRVRLYWREDGKQRRKTLISFPKPKSKLTDAELKEIENALRIPERQNTTPTKKWIHKATSARAGKNGREGNAKKTTEVSKETLDELVAPQKIDKNKLKARITRPKISKKVEIAEGTEVAWLKAARDVTVEPTWFERVFGGEEVERYDLQKHGPLVDLGVPTGMELIETYPVNEPYAYTRMMYEPATREHCYHVIEPKLTEGEQNLLNELQDRLIETLDMDLKGVDRQGALQYLTNHIDEFLRSHHVDLTPVSKEKIMYYVTRNFLGYEEIDPIMHDINIEDISCDGPNIPIFIYHKKFGSVRSNVVFEDVDKLDSFIIKLAQISGRHISIADPLLDGTLSDGSRIQLTLGKEITTRGSTFTIRKFRESPFTPPELIESNTLSVEAIAYLWLAVENAKSIIFAGGTASGKTTTLNAISLFIPPETKIVSIEDTRELNLLHQNWIPGVVRETSGRAGGIDMYDLLRSALRQRPEFLIVGEVRGEEAYVMFQAMATGHTTFSTMHADSLTSVVHRLENPPINIPRILIKSLDVVCINTQTYVSKQRVRRTKTLVEVIGMDQHTNELLTNEVFRWNHSDDTFKYSGSSHVLKRIMEERNWDNKEMGDELKRRQDILKWMVSRGIKDYKDVTEIVIRYYQEPEELMKTVKRELYGS